MPRRSSRSPSCRATASASRSWTPAWRCSRRSSGGSAATGWRPRLPGGAGLYRDTGTAFSDENFRKTEAADAILFGAMGLPDVRYPDGTEIAPASRDAPGYGLYAGVRPSRALCECRAPLADPRAAGIDLVILRESTEGLFASRGKGKAGGRRWRARPW